MDVVRFIVVEMKDGTQVPDVTSLSIVLWEKKIQPCLHQAQYKGQGSTVVCHSKA